MSTIIARTYSGAIDLWHGVPNLKDAVIINVKYDESEYATSLIIKDVKGIIHTIIIRDMN
jgi:hypothetical protein